MSLRRILLTIFCLSFPLWAAGIRTATPSLKDMAQKSAYIFAGTVLQVRRAEPSEPYGVPTMQVTLRVDQAIRGVRARQVISIREWAGSWSQGERYRAGERLLLFLYGKSKLGLTSPVGGEFGRFEIDGNGEVVVEAARISALSADPVLKAPLRGVPPRSNTTVRGQDFRRAVMRAMENDR